MKRLTLLIFGLALCSGLLYSQQKELKVLFVGNSYTYGYNLAHIVSIISQETSTHLLTRKSTIGGASLREHWIGGRELETKKIIAEGNFDAVVLQDFSMFAIHTPDSLLKYVRLFTEYNSAYEPQSRRIRILPQDSRRAVQRLNKIVNQIHNIYS